MNRPATKSRLRTPTLVPRCHPERRTRSVRSRRTPTRSKLSTCHPERRTRSVRSRRTPIRSTLLSWRPKNADTNPHSQRSYPLFGSWLSSGAQNAQRSQSKDPYRSTLLMATKNAYRCGFAAEGSRVLPASASSPACPQHKSAKPATPTPSIPTRSVAWSAAPAPTPASIRRRYCPPPAPTSPADRSAKRE